MRAAQGSHQTALTDYTRAIAALRELGDPRGEAYSLHNSAESYASLKQWAKAAELYQQSLAKKRAIGDRYGEGISLQRMAHLDNQAGRTNRIRGGGARFGKSFGVRTFAWMIER